MSLLTSSLRRAALFLVLCRVTTVWGQVASSSPHSISRAVPPAAGENLLITVVDENDVPVAIFGFSLGGMFINRRTRKQG